MPAPAVERQRGADLRRDRPGALERVLGDDDRAGIGRLGIVGQGEGAHVGVVAGQGDGRIERTGDGVDAHAVALPLLGGQVDGIR